MPSIVNPESNQNLMYLKSKRKECITTKIIYNKQNTTAYALHKLNPKN